MKGLEKDSKRTPNWLSLAGMSCDIANLSYITKHRKRHRQRQTDKGRTREQAWKSEHKRQHERELMCV